MARKTCYNTNKFESVSVKTVLATMLHLSLNSKVACATQGRCGFLHTMDYGFYFHDYFPVKDFPNDDSMASNLSFSCCQLALTFLSSMISFFSSSFSFANC